MLNQIIFLFIDGIGLGEPSSANPFAQLSLPAFNRLAGNQSWDSRHVPVLSSSLCFRSLDACLGVAGYPQSGTGQATLFTGHNCATIAGRHFGPYPHSATRDTIRSYNLFTQIKAQQKTVAFSNAYPPVFFETAQKRDRYSVTTRACLDSKTRIRGLEDLSRGAAVAADITGDRLVSLLDLPVRIVSEAEAAANLLAVSSSRALTLFEYFHTDKAGHAQSLDQATRCLESLDRFIEAILRPISGTSKTLIITSDHGNLEDLGTKTHTFNPVPFAAFGPRAIAFAGIKSIQDVAPVIVDLMKS